MKKNAGLRFFRSRLTLILKIPNYSTGLLEISSTDTKANLFINFGHYSISFSTNGSVDHGKALGYRPNKDGLIGQFLVEAL